MQTANGQCHWIPTALRHHLQAAQALRDEDDAAAPGTKRKQPDQGKLDEAVEREKAKQLKAKEAAKEKASSVTRVSLLGWEMHAGVDDVCRQLGLQLYGRP